MQRQSRGRAARSASWGGAMTAQDGPASAPGWDPQPGPESMDAFSALFAAYARSIFNYCSSLLGDQAEAEAATRAALIAACSLVEHLYSHSRPRAWLIPPAATESIRKP